MPKEDCKYWDKCYQQNEYHLQKYNHPTKKPDEHACKQKKAAFARQDELDKHQKEAPKADIKNDDSDQPKCSTSSTATETNPPKPPQENITQKRRLSDEQQKETTIRSTERKEIDIAEVQDQVYQNLSGKNYLAMLEKRIRLSIQAEYAQLVSSNEFIRHKFLVEMPPDFFAFWKFICELSKQPEGGKAALEYFEKQFQLKLVGPFEFLAGLFHEATIREPGDYLRHWRFFFDPPEFQTIFVRCGAGIHYGYWRDTPEEKESLLVARNDVSKGCEFEFVGGNVFEAFQYYLQHDSPASPFTAATVANAKRAVKEFLATNKLNYENLETLKKIRAPKVLARTLHRAGIVAPFEKKGEVGYRPLLTSDAELKKVFSLYEGGKRDNAQEVIMSKLQPIAAACTIAMDESDFATSLEFGIDLFCSGRLELHALAQSMLIPAYSLLSRPQFIAISKAHMEKRSRGIKLSMFDLDKV